MIQHYRNFTKAAQAYQIALRADPTDVSAWVQLGEAYVKCGRQVAGLKTLQHALELDPSSWMARYDIGEIHTQLGSYDQAIEAYEQIDSGTETKEVGVTAAAAEAMLALGRQAAAGGFRERSRRAFHGAIALARTVLEVGHRHRPWAWKIVGDTAFELSGQESNTLDAELSAEVLRPVLQILENDDTDRRSSVRGLGHAANILQSPVSLNLASQTAVFAFAYRVHLLKNEPRVSFSALYDFASALHALAQRETDNSIKSACLKGAISAVRLALERDAGDERLWNALGVLCGEAGPEVAQHAFVVSLELYAKVSER